MHYDIYIYTCNTCTFVYVYIYTHTPFWGSIFYAQIASPQGVSETSVSLSSLVTACGAAWPAALALCADCAAEVQRGARAAAMAVVEGGGQRRPEVGARGGGSEAPCGALGFRSFLGRGVLRVPVARWRPLLPMFFF